MRRTKASILHADDHAMFRESLQRLIALLTSEFEVTVQTETTSNILPLIKCNDIDILLLDINIDGSDICSIIKRCLIEVPKLKVIALSMHEDIYIINSIFNSGAIGYISKGSSHEHLIACMKSAMKGQKYICPITSQKLANQLGKTSEPAHHKLSYREFHILNLLATGDSINKIANDLNLSPKTVSSHKSRIKKKLNLNNNAEIYRYFNDVLNH